MAALNEARSMHETLLVPCKSLAKTLSTRLKSLGPVSVWST